jgi:hypothetical protein
VRAALTATGARAWQVDAVAEPITAAFIRSLDDDIAEPSEPIVDEDQTTPTAPSDES